MSLRRLALGLAAAAAAALVAALPAAGKEDVEATLRTSIPLDAPAGTRLAVAWRLAYVDEDGRRRPFGAGGVFVRLLSASGAGSEEGYAPTRRSAPGEYAATVVVPEGGIGDVEIGLMGWRSDPTGTRRADALFAITNDPVPGGARVAPPAPGQLRSEHAGTGSRSWTILLVGGLLSTLAVLGAALVRRNGDSGVRRTRGSAIFARRNAARPS